MMIVWEERRRVKVLGESAVAVTIIRNLQSHVYAKQTNNICNILGKVLFIENKYNAFIDGILHKLLVHSRILQIPPVAEY